MTFPLAPEYTDQIKRFEGYSPRAAWDYKQSSSGYGTKAQAGDENLPPDQLRAAHEQRFNDAITAAAAHVDAVNPNLPPGARAALISLTYNAGGGWANAGLGQMVRDGDLAGAQQRMQEYNKAGGSTLPGLVDRRAQEARWFDQPATGGGQPAAPLAMAPGQPAAAPVPQAATQRPTPTAEAGAPLSLAPPQQQTGDQQPNTWQFGGGQPQQQIEAIMPDLQVPKMRPRLQLPMPNRRGIS